MSNDTIDGNDAGCAGTIGNPEAFQIYLPGTNGVFDTTEALAWEVAGPHAALAASVDFVIQGFSGDEPGEAAANDALADVWNRILARNLARAEGTTQLMLSAGREALGHFEDAQCRIAYQTMRQLDDPSFNVTDGQ